MQSLKDILQKFNPTEDKYISSEYQAFGVYLSQKLEDEKRKSLYIKMAKGIPRPVLEKALRFVIDSKADNKAALFMWKLKELGTFEKYSLKTERKKKTEKTKTVRKRKKAQKGLFEA
jgi:hypothetical protein